MEDIVICSICFGKRNYVQTISILHYIMTRGVIHIARQLSTEIHELSTNLCYLGDICYSDLEYSLSRISSKSRRMDGSVLTSVAMR